MATKKPRVTVTLEQDDYERLRVLSEMNGESMSALISGLVSSVAPVLERIVDAGRRFEQLQGAVRDDTLRRLEEAQAELDPVVEGMQADFLAMLSDIPNPLDDGPADPRPVTRGSRPPSPPSTTSPDSAVD